MGRLTPSLHSTKAICAKLGGSELTPIFPLPAAPNNEGDESAWRPKMTQYGLSTLDGHFMG